MKFTETTMEGVFIIEPTIFNDNRGLFCETFNENEFQKATRHQRPFVQDNYSLSTYGVMRGLHLQKGEAAQSKIVRVTSGRVLDVVVDLRKESDTYCKYYSIELSGENKKQLFFPRGFAHGFVVLSSSAEFVYKCDNFYSPKHESGLRFDDETISIDWKIPPQDMIVSEKDLKLPNLEDLIRDLSR